MLGYRVDELLGPPSATPEKDDSADLMAHFAAARAADAETVAAFQQRLDLARVLDRRLGGNHLIAELSEQVRHMQSLCRYSTDSRTRLALASIIADACTLLGWQWLDEGNAAIAWDYYAGHRLARE